MSAHCAAPDEAAASKGGGVTLRTDICGHKVGDGLMRRDGGEDKLGDFSDPPYWIDVGLARGLDADV